MYFPDLKEFKIKAKKRNLIPVYREIIADIETPVSVFLKIDEGDYSFLLESVVGDEKVATYSFLGTEPYLIFKSKGRQIEITEKNNKKTLIENNPFYILKKLLNKYKIIQEPGLPRFIGGAVGYVSYDAVRFFEKIPDTKPDSLNLPELLFIFTNTFLIFDHIHNIIKIVANTYLDGGNLTNIYNEAIFRIEEIIKKLNKSLKIKNTYPKNRERKKIKISSNLTKKKFKQIVLKAKEYILNGDITQTVLSQRFKVKINCNHFDIYRALRFTNPSPYMFYLKFKELKLIGSSPEIFVRLDQGIVEERPIAGTRQRGQTEKEDILLEKELLNSKKEKAEHIMLVDLSRNDIGRVCKYGSIKVSDFMSIEKYSQVMHIVTDVKGILKKNKKQFDVIKACFPAGTVSGAPKIRAMEIIDELEPTKRNCYAGAVAYFSFSGNLDSCIIIRTILIKKNIAYIQAGAGIVAGSCPEKEYKETVNKAKALILAIKLAEKGL